MARKRAATKKADKDSSQGIPEEQLLRHTPIDASGYDHMEHSVLRAHQKGKGGIVHVPYSAKDDHGGLTLP